MALCRILRTGGPVGTDQWLWVASRDDAEPRWSWVDSPEQASLFDELALASAIASAFRGHGMQVRVAIAQDVGPSHKPTTE